jgi:hypothetical protein
MTVPSPQLTNEIDRPLWMMPPRVLLEGDEIGRPIQHLDARSFTVYGATTPAGAEVHATFLICPALSITVLARANEPPGWQQASQVFSFIEPDVDVLSLVLAMAAPVRVQ